MEGAQANDPLRVLKIWDAEYPWDVRAEKVARALTERGHDVLMVARNRDGRTLREELPECRMLRMRPLRGLPKKVAEASQFPAFFNPRWSRLIRKGARELGADVLLVRDLPLAPTAIWAGRRLGLPVVLDMAENYAAMMNDLWLTGTQGPLDWAIRNPKIVRRVENWVASRVDHIVVVVEESAQRLIRIGVEPDRITVVGNTPPLERVRKTPHPQTAGDPVRLAYLGLIEEARGVRTLLDALAICKKEGCQVLTDIIGDGRDRETLVTHADQLGLSDSVVFHGFVPHRDALDIVARADWGAIPHHANEAWNTTIPNKLFDYMAEGMAVIASDAAPVKRVVSETGCGAIFPSRDPEALARILIESSALDRTSFGEAGRRAVRTQYHWEQDVGRLVECLRRAAARPLVHGSPPESVGPVHV
ncbi:MAG: glycosyltransferase family 4 protein, partial [Longimicrobiales bacterium]